MHTQRSVWPAAMFLIFPMSSLNANAQKASPTEPAEITMRVYNYARINSYTLDRTQRRVSEIFMEAGFKIHWIQCPRCKEERSQYPDCTPELGPGDLVLTIMPRINMEKNGLGEAAFGLTTGSNILISTERLYDIANKSEQTCDRILGLAVAHEIGHALLGTNSHSKQGIMCPRWYSNDLQPGSRRTAGFTEEQIERMHRNWMAARDAGRPGGTARTALNP
jgi:hypothetical protein